VSDGLRKVASRTAIGEQKTAICGTRHLFGERWTVIGERRTVIGGESDSDFLQMTVVGGTRYVFGEGQAVIGERRTEIVTEL
jgi:hypothetical protein